ncbi:MAG: GrpB family protein [Actinomycetota bacterium]|nr:GrpB family protein [Actinomycetota bacterium]
MQIFRFDPEVSIPIDHFGSDFRIGRLTEEGTKGRVQVLHLGPGGMVGRHRTGLRQLFAVVSGSGQVSGNDGSYRVIRAGQAAVWEAGEEHDVRSDDGLVALCVEGTFEMQAVAVTKDIVVVDYDPAWPQWFEHVRAYLWPAVEKLACGIDHVGSTSVFGLAAKPIIDVDIVVADDAGVRPVIDALAPLGYRWVGDLGVDGRQAFDTPTHPTLPRHHLYLVVEGSKAHRDHVLLRDLLRADPDARRRYAELKRANVELAQGDIDVYVAAKAPFVAGLLTRARAELGLEPASYFVPDLPGEAPR